MESFEFLGGRYNRPEQIMSGPVQAFRAQNAANGRTVFIHRVSTTEAPEEQSALLKLLTTALVKSADAKRLVLDFGEEAGYWYVVTESEPQCALLREWLQLEIDSAVAGGQRPFLQSSAPKPEAPTATPHEAPDPGEFTRYLKGRPASPAAPSRILSQIPPAPAPTPQVPPVAPAAQPPVQPEAPAAGSEFSRFFKQSSFLAPSQPPVPPAPPMPEARKPLPGEFTSFFNHSGAERKSMIPTTPPAANPPAFAPPTFSPESIVEPQAESKEPGEFTRYFKPGLPTPPAKSAPFAHGLSGTQNPYVQRPTSHVQRPDTPIRKLAETGEFTKLFSRPENTTPPAAPAPNALPQAPAVRSDPMGFAKIPSNTPEDLSEDLFNDKIDVGQPLSSSQPPQSEFTKVFGAMGKDAPPVQPPSVVAQTQEWSLLDERPMQAPGAAPSTLSPADTAAPAEVAPSEFTRIMQGGNQAPAKPAAGAAPLAPAASGKAPSGGSSPINVNISPINPMASLPRAGMQMAGLSHMPHAGGAAGGVHANAGLQGASVSSAVGSAHVQGPHLPAPHLQAPAAKLQLPAATNAGSHRKLIIFFVLIGALAVILIVVVLFMMKSK